MIFQRTLDHLLPRSESDAKFREYVGRLAVSGLVTLAIVEIAAALVQRSALMVAIAALTLAAARIGRARRYPRAIGALSVLLGAAVTARGGAAGDHAVTVALLVVVAAAASIPFLPWHALALGFGSGLIHLAVGRPDANYMLLILLALLAAGIAASNHSHRWREFEAQQEAVRVAESLTGAQLRAQLAENAISIGKMAAALSHEINSPLGVLRSSIATLCSLDDRRLDPERLEQTRAQLRQSVEESAARIEEVTSRLRRFINLDEAEVKSADINELLTDVTLLHRDELDKARVQLEFDLERELPPLNCRPQLLTAAFSSLLSNAINAVNGDGRIAIATRGRDGEVEVTIRDNGRGMSPEEADTIFDPSFKVAAGRVASGNWSLFNSRQIVYEHGGGIRLETAPGQGTAMHVTLPVV
jgi:signal transduction histidine kinase